jgi:hypothetical protein
MATKEPSSTAASVAPSSRGRVPPSEKSRKPRARDASKHSGAKSVLGAVATGSRTQHDEKKKAGKDARAPSNTATLNPKTGTPSPSTETPPPTGPNGYPVYSTTKLGELYDMDRAVVRRRLKEKKIKPFAEGPRKADYELTPEVEEALEGGTRRAELDAREQELDIEWKKARLDKATGRLVDFDEFCDVATKLVKGIYDRFMQYASKASPRLHKSKTAREHHLAMRRDLEKIFGELRGDFRRFIK